MSAKSRPERPAKRKKIIIWILSLMVVTGILLAVINSVILLFAVDMQEYADDMAFFCTSGLDRTLLTCDMDRLREAWESGERNEEVAKMEATAERLLAFLERAGQRVPDAAYMLISDGRGGYRYGGGIWRREGCRKAFLSPASELSEQSCRILDSSDPMNCIMLNLTKSRESKVFSDIACLGLETDPQTWKGLKVFYCIEPPDDSLHDWTINISQMAWILFSIGPVSLLALFSMLAIVSLLLRRRILVPLGKLEQSIKTYEIETARESDPSKWSYEKPKNYIDDEIGFLIDSVTVMAEDLKKTTVDLLFEVKDKEKKAAELNMAAKIQAGALPSSFPAFPSRKDFDIFASMKPAKVVGGDFYDFFLVDEDHLAIVVADISGSGLPAALFMMQVKATIRNLSLLGLSPAAVLEKANMLICESNSEFLFATVFIGSLCLSSGVLTCANAGHTNPAIRRANGFTVYLREPHDLALGIRKDLSFTDYRHEMKKGDFLFAYTDGITEAMSGDEDMFGAERLQRTLKDIKEPTCGGLISGLLKSLDEFAKGAEQHDDITMLAVQYFGIT